jgi:predicted CopG family antitoxin
MSKTITVDDQIGQKIDKLKQEMEEKVRDDEKVSYSKVMKRIFKKAGM